MEPQGTAAEVAERGRKLALLPASGAADPHTRMLILRESVSLLYYPLWLVDYQVADRPYRIVVDANDGTVNSGHGAGRQRAAEPRPGAQGGGAAGRRRPRGLGWPSHLGRRPRASHLPSRYSVYSCVPAGAQVPIGREGGIPRALFQLI